MEEASLGWAAGILDFQGHVIRKDNKLRASGSVQVVLYVDTSNVPIIKRLSAMTGTDPSFTEHSPMKEEWTRKGCTEHCPEAHVHVILEGMPMIARWQVTGCSAAIVLWNLREHMVTVHEPWDRAMAIGFASTRLSGQGSGAAVAAIRRMASLGWEMPPIFRDVLPKQIANIR